jgi:molybdate transport system regulatory protein
MAPRRARRRRQPKLLAPRVKVWLETGGRYAFGFGISEILQAVDRAGSIKQAAVDLGLSYRYVWGRIKDAEEALGQELVEAQVGGSGTQRSSLTPQARHLVTAFMALRSRMQQLLHEEFTQHFD